MSDRFQCPTCRERYVVPSLAEQCERKHAEEEVE